MGIFVLLVDVYVMSIFFVFMVDVFVVLLGCFRFKVFGIDMW